jgi:hypothetical protein
MGSVQVIVTFDSLCQLARSYARHQVDADALCLDLALAARATPAAKALLLAAFRLYVDARTGPQASKSFTAAQGAELKLLSTRL